MKLTPQGPNSTEIELDNGYTVLFSYSTPVAAHRPAGGFIRTEKFWSNTTSRHINTWLKGAQAEEVPQEKFDDITSAIPTSDV